MLLKYEDLTVKCESKIDFILLASFRLVLEQLITAQQHRRDMQPSGCTHTITATLMAFVDNSLKI